MSDQGQGRKRSSVLSAPKLPHGEKGEFGCADVRLPLIPPAPFSHTGRRGSLGVLEPETEVARDCGRAVMTTAPLRCTFAPHPPCPLLPQGEKGEFGRPGARNGRWHAEACQQTYPCEAARGRDTRAPKRRQHRPTFILVVRDCGRAVMTTAPLRCTVAPHPPCSLLPHGEKGEFGCANARLPLIPPAPFSHTGRRGSLGVLKPETSEGTQGLPEKPAPVRLHAGETPALPRGDSVDRHSFRLSAIAVAP
jgi:hypothetical protein